MTIERTDVQIEVKGEQQAVAKTNTVAAAMERLRLKAEQAKAAQADAERLSLKSRAANFFSARNMLALGKGGFKPGALARGITGGGLGAFAATHIALHGTERLADNAADLADYLRTNPSAGQVLRDARDNIAGYFQRPVANVAGSLRRLFGGRSKEQAEAEVEELLASLDPAKQAAEDAARRAAMRRARRQAAEAERREAEAEEARIAVVNSKSRDQLDKALAGLANETLPVGLRHGTALRYHAERQEQVRHGQELARLNAINSGQKRMMAGEGD
jgi:hypothetical protein